MTRTSPLAAPASPDAGAPPRPAALPITRLDPPGGWELLNLSELWQYRELIFFLSWRDVKVRYKQTLLGAAWAILQPALMMVVFTIFFARMANVSSGGVPYPLFAYTGLLPWTFFSSALSNAGSSVVNSERLITKIYFPRLAVPLAAVSAALADFVMAFGLLLAMMLYYGYLPGVGFLLVPVVMALLAFGALGLGAMLAALNVSYRDFRYIIPFFVQLGMFATPSIYMVPNLNGSLVSRLALTLNPITALVSTFRAAILGGPIPWAGLGLSAVLLVTLAVLGLFYFRRAEAHFADVI